MSAKCNPRAGTASPTIAIPPAEPVPATTRASRWWSHAGRRQGEDSGTRPRTRSDGTMMEPTPLSASSSGSPPPRTGPSPANRPPALNTPASTDDARSGDARMHGVTSAERWRWGEPGLGGSALGPLVGALSKRGQGGYPPPPCCAHRHTPRTSRSSSSGERLEDNALKDLES